MAPPVTLLSIPAFQQAEDKYTNLLLGAGFNLGTIGALSFDGSQSWADVKTSDTASSTSKEQGNRIASASAKAFCRRAPAFPWPAIATPPRDTIRFQDFVDNASTQRDCCTQSGRTKGRFDASLSQTLFGYGSLSLSLVNETYWDSSRMESVGVGYSGSIGRASYFINYSYNRNVQSTDDSGNNRPASDTIVSLTLSIPLGETLSANYTLNHGRHNDTTHSVGLNGSAFEDRLSTGVSRRVTTPRIRAPPATSASIIREQKAMSPAAMATTTTAITTIIRCAAARLLTRAGSRCRAFWVRVLH